MEIIHEHPITIWLRSRNWRLTAYTAVAAFSLYTCVYVFRKAFPVASFDGAVVFGMKYKVWLIVFQAIGYALSKFVGIKVISELKTNQRSHGILLLTGIALTAWFIFALVPSPYNMVLLMLNGLSLGMIWGIIFSYLEGRRVTEILGAALSISFVFSSGLARTVGSVLITRMNVEEMWMPFVASLIFLLPLRLSLWLLDKVPAPTIEDQSLRTKRLPMSKPERIKFTITFLPGIILFILCYVLLTTFRDFRDNFSPEVWHTLGYGKSPEIFTLTEIPISFVILLLMGAMILVRNNFLAFGLNHLLIACGLLLTGVATYSFESQQIAAPLWMTLVGLGLYMAYVPFNSIFFDRMLATFQYPGTVGFIMYLADAFGYLGSLGVLIIKEFSYPTVEWISFFIKFSYALAATGTLLMLGSWVYFSRKYNASRREVVSMPLMLEPLNEDEIYPIKKAGSIR